MNTRDNRQLNLSLNNQQKETIKATFASTYENQKPNNVYLNSKILAVYRKGLATVCMFSTCTNLMLTSNENIKRIAISWVVITRHGVEWTYSQRVSIENE